MTAPSAPTADTKSEDWVAFNEGLSRKTTETLQTWLDRYDRGVIGLSTMISILSALYDTTSGLIGADISTLIADCHRDLVKEAQTKR